MNRRDFLKFLGSMSFLGLLPARSLTMLTENEKQLEITDVEKTYTPEQVDALQKIKFYEDQLQQQGGHFSWHIHNKLRHYWGAFSEAKSLSYANIILANMIMDPYILNTLSDWYYAPECQPVQPTLAIESLQRRAENYSDLHYVRVASWLRAGEISSATGNITLARNYYQYAITITEEFMHQAPQLSFYQRIAQFQLTDKL